MAFAGTAIGANDFFGIIIAVALAGLAMFAGFGILSGSSRKAALVTGIGLAVFTGLAGQDLGAILTGGATDPGAGPLFVLLALSLWPQPAPAHHPRPAPLPTRRRSPGPTRPIAPAAP